MILSQKHECFFLRVDCMNKVVNQIYAQGHKIYQLVLKSLWAFIVSFWGVGGRQGSKGYFVIFFVLPET